MEENDSGLIDLVVRTDPTGKANGVTVRKTSVDIFLVAGRETVNYHKGATSSITAAGDIDLLASSQLITVGHSHHAIVCKFPHRDTKFTVVVFHITLPYFNVIAQPWMNFISLTITWS